MVRNFNLCDTKDCREIFCTYFCKKCGAYQDNYCRKCHELHFSEIQRMKQLSKLKRDFVV
jgi:hypothetical protein